MRGDDEIHVVRVEQPLDGGPKVAALLAADVGARRAVQRAMHVRHNPVNVGRRRRRRKLGREPLVLNAAGNKIQGQEPVRALGANGHDAHSPVRHGVEERRRRDALPRHGEPRQVALERPEALVVARRGHVRNIRGHKLELAPERVEERLVAVRVRDVAAVHDEIDAVRHHKRVDSRKRAIGRVSRAEVANDGHAQRVLRRLSARPRDKVELGNKRPVRRVPEGADRRVPHAVVVARVRREPGHHGRVHPPQPSALGISRGAPRRVRDIVSRRAAPENHGVRSLLERHPRDAHLRRILRERKMHLLGRVRHGAAVEGADREHGADPARRVLDHNRLVARVERNEHGLNVARAVGLE
eukprot:Amastigsp_a174867_84.p2 type:complete len:356 gc:universal Amastigsp_a174867_84:408-1475(+)